MGRGEKETVFPSNFRLWLVVQAFVCFEKLLIDLIHSPMTFEIYWKLASIPTRVVSRAKRYFLNCKSLTYYCSKKSFFSGEESTVEPQQIEGSVRTRRKQRDCVSRAVSSYRRFSTNLRFENFVILKYIVQGHPARGRKWAPNGRREKRKTTKQVSFCGELNPELISKCLRGPASQIGYQRERDVTGELIWKE